MNASIESDRVCARSGSRAVASFVPCLALLAVVTAVPAVPARADCDLATAPNVVCSGTDTDGFDGTGLNVDQVTVLGAALVDNGGAAGVDAIRVDADDQVTVVGGGRVQATGAGAAAIRGGDDIELQAGATIDVSGGPAGGILVGDDATVLVNGQINAPFGVGVGVQAGNSASVTIGATGVVDVSADDAVGISLGETSSGSGAFLQSGSILRVSGARVVGVSVGERTSGGTDNLFAGTIEITGDDAVGVRLVEGEADLSGSLSATGARVIGIDAGDDSQSIVNTGSIVVDGSDAIAMRGGNNAGRVQSAGTVTVRGSGARGLVVGSSDRFLQNQAAGTITLEASATNGAAMDAASGLGAGSEVKVDNFGAIDVSAADAFGIRADDLALVQNASGASLVVSGANAIGIQVDADSIVTNAGTVEATGSDGVGIVIGASGGNGSELSNSGTVRGGSGNNGVAVRLAGAAGGIVRNLASGVIETSVAGQGLAIEGSAGGDQITNAGEITGDTRLGAGDDTYTLETGGRISGVLDGGSDVDEFVLDGSGSDVFEVGTTAQPEIENFETLRMTSGTWTLRGTLRAADGWANGLSVEGGSAQLTTPFVVDGDYVQGESASLDVELDSQVGSGSLQVAGSATLQDSTPADDGTGAQLIVRLADSPLATPFFTNGSTLAVLSADGGITGAFDRITLPAATAVLGFSESVTAGQVLVTISRASYGSVTPDVNATAVGEYLDAALLAAPGGDFATHLGLLDRLDAGPLSQSLSQLHAEPYEAHTVMALAAGHQFGRLLGERAMVCDNLPEREEEKVSPCGERGLEPWADLWIRVGSQNGDGERIDFDTKSGGLVFGADYRVTDFLVVGGALGASVSRMEIDGHGDGVLSTVDVGARAELHRDGFAMRSALDYGHGWHESERDLRSAGLFRQGQGEFQSNRIGFRTEFSYERRFFDLRLQPVAGIDLTHLRQHFLVEEGADSLSLVVDERKDLVVAALLGLRVSGHFVRYSYLPGVYELGDGVWTPEFQIRYRRIVSGADRDLDAALRGAPGTLPRFRTRAEGQENEVELGFSINYQPTEGMTINARYELRVGELTLDHIIGAKLRIPF